MKLRKRLNRKVGNIEYAKWEINIPSKKVNEAGWKAGIDLEIDIKNGKMILRPKKVTK